MYQNGHIGASLLVYAPFAFIAAVFGGLQAVLIGAVVAGGLASLPDLDMRVPLVKHRGPTHTVWFAALVGIALAILGGIAGFQRGAVSAVVFFFLGGVVGSLSILSHIAADALTPMGIRPFTPWSSKRYTWDLVKAANPIANYLLLGLGVVASGVAGFAGLWLNGLLGL